MKLSSNSPLAVELRDQEVRQHTVESQIKIGIPFQLRAMREHRGWTQETLAEKLGTTQNTISRLENPKTAKPTITTLLRFATAFDVGLLVRFVPFGFYGGVIEAMDTTHIEVPSYEEEVQVEMATEQPIINEVDQASVTGLNDQEPAGVFGIEQSTTGQRGTLVEMTREMQESGARQTPRHKQPRQEYCSALGGDGPMVAQHGRGL